MSQPAYIDKKIAQFNIDTTKPCNLPSPAKSDLHQLVKQAKAEGRFSTTDTTQFLSMISSLRYIQQVTRFDISYYVGVASRYMQEPNNIVYDYCCNIWRYLHTTRTQGIFAARGKPGQKLTIQAYCDAEFGTDLKHATTENPTMAASIAGGVVMLGTMPVAWWSKKLNSTSLSTGESEMLAMTETVKDILEVHSIAEGLEIGITSIPILHTDSNTAKEWTEHHWKQFKRTRHFGHKYFWLLDKRRENVFQSKFIGTALQRADIFTKPLPRPAFESHVRALMSLTREEE